MTDDRLGELLRAAMPPTSPDAPVRDVWPEIGERIAARPRWSLLDLSLAAAVAIALLLNPEWLWLLAYHL